jgi:hypothetical protein
MTTNSFFRSDFLNEYGTLVQDQENFQTQMDGLQRKQAYAINRRDIGQYGLIEQLNGQQFLNVTTPIAARSVAPPHYIFRKIVECGALPNAALKQVAHGIATIDNNWFFTRIYGTAREPLGVAPRPYYIPLPGSGAHQVDLMVDATNINITTIANLSTFTYSIVILEYWKS